MGYNSHNSFLKKGAMMTINGLKDGERAVITHLGVDEQSIASNAVNSLPICIIQKFFRSRTYGVIPRH